MKALILAVSALTANSVVLPHGILRWAPFSQLATRLGSIGPNGSEPGDGTLVPGSVPPLPQVANQFQANVAQQNTLFPFGTLKGKYYYDFGQQADRFDATFLGTTQIMLNLYSTGDAYTVTGTKGNYECTWSNLTTTQMSTQVPPIANYLGTQTINGNTNTQVYDFDLFGIAYERSWNTVPTSDPKALCVPVRSYVKISVAGVTLENLLDFSSVVIGPQNASIFDPSQFNCKPPVPPVSYTVAGYITDAVTNRAIPNAAVVVNGTDSNGRTWTQSATANGQGAYSISGVPEGTIVVQASSSGYIAAVSSTIVVKGSIAAGTVADLALSPVLQEKSFRVVLKWGCCPPDLDAHMLTPSGVDVYYGNKNAGGASLDQDRTTGYGPETISVPDRTLGVWKYFVFNYSGGDMRQSNAVVTLYTSEGAVQTVAIPTNQDSQRWWHVFDVDASGKVTLVNQLVPSEN